MSETAFRPNGGSAPPGSPDPSAPPPPPPERPAPPVSAPPVSAAPASAAPLLTRTVPREYVHRAAMAEVLLTGWHRVDEARFAVTAQWPRRHFFFVPVEGRHDPLLTAETVRQAGTLLSHTAFGTPLGHQFLMRELSFRVDPERLLIGAAPAELELDVRCTRIRRRGTELVSMRYDTVVHLGGHVVATGGASFSCASPGVYRRLRGDRAGALSSDHAPPAAPGVPPEHVGRSEPSDVVLSPTEDAQVWHLRTDPAHPVLFDHPVDHVPGMLLLEAARQAAHATSGSGLPTGFTCTFTRYAELGVPCRVEARYRPGDSTAPASVLVTGEQEGEEVFHCVVALSSSSVRAPIPGARAR